MKSAKGFTLIELMVTVAILAIIVSVAIPAYTGYVTRGRITEATSGLSGMRVQMEQYYQDNRGYANVGACGNLNLPQAGKYFTFSCNAALLTQNTYQIKATGQGAMAGFEYTIDQVNNKTSNIFAPATASGWSNPNPNTCWVTNKGGLC